TFLPEDRTHAFKGQSRPFLRVGRRHARCAVQSVKRRYVQRARQQRPEAWRAVPIPAADAERAQAAAVIRAVERDGLVPPGGDASELERDLDRIRTAGRQQDLAGAAAWP